MKTVPSKLFSSAFLRKVLDKFARKSVDKKPFPSKTNMHSEVVEKGL